MPEEANRLSAEDRIVVREDQQVMVLHGLRSATTNSRGDLRMFIERVMGYRFSYFVCTPAHTESRGLAWVVGAFPICPCHLRLRWRGAAPYSRARPLAFCGTPIRLRQAYSSRRCGRRARGAAHRPVRRAPRYRCASASPVAPTALDSTLKTDRSRAPRTNAALRALVMNSPPRIRRGVRLACTGNCANWA
jgi:hypothetical protein